MAEKSETKIQELLLALVSKSMFGTPVVQDLSDFTKEDFVELFKEARNQSVVAMALDGFESPAAVLGDKIYKAWLRASRANILNSQKVYENHGFVAELLEKAGIPYAILKGCTSAYYYDNYHLRSMGDVDLLVSEENIEKALKLLNDNGWEKIHYECTYHYDLEKKGEGIIELHYEPPGIPKGSEVEAAVRRITDEIIATSEIISFDNIKMCVPDKVHHFFVMILHISHHMAPFGIGLRHLCDLAVFFASSVTKEMWENELVPMLKDCGLYNFSKTLLAVAEKHLHMPTHGIDFGADEKSREDFIADIIDGGNFGRKDDDRVGDKALSARLAANNTKNVAASTFETLINVTKAWYPVAEKHPVTLPWFAVCALTRFFYRRITGKRKIATTPSRISSAVRRKAMFERLNYLKPGN